MSKLVDAIKAGPGESGLGNNASQRPDEQDAQRKKKDPLFGLSGKKGIGPYSKGSERVQSLSLSNQIVSRIKKSDEKDKQEAKSIQDAQAAAEQKYRDEHPAPISDSQSEKIQARKKVAGNRRSSGRVSTVLSDTLG